MQSEDCGSNKKTAEYCASIAVKNIANIFDKYGTEVFALCTDSENKMVAMRRIIKTKYPKMLVYGCSNHYLNLVDKAVTPSAMKEIIEIQTYFRNHHRPNALLMDRKGLKSQVPNEIRWSSQCECVRTFCENWHIYNEIVNTHDNDNMFTNDIKKKIRNFQCYKYALELREQLAIIKVAMDTMQADDVTLSQTYRIWIDLLNNDRLHFYHDAIAKRAREAMPPFHYLAKLFSEALSKLFSEAQDIVPPGDMAILDEWLSEYYPEFIAPYMAFKIRDYDYFDSCMFRDDVLSKFTGFKWWS